MIKDNLTGKAASRDAVASHTLKRREGGERVLGAAPGVASRVGGAAAALRPAHPALRALVASAGLALALTIGLAASPSPAFADEEPAPAAIEAAGEEEPGTAFGRAVAALTATVVNEQSAQEMDAYAAHLEAIGAEAARASKVDALLAEALSHQGAPYVYGGTTPRGFDCSGFTSYVFRTALGIELPRTAAAQSGLGSSVSLDALEPGDLLFWGRGSGVYHVAVYVGEGNYVHAAGSGKGVRVQSMDYFHPAFAKRLV